MRFLLASLLTCSAYAAQPTVLVDEIFDIAPRKAGAVHLNLRQRTASVKCWFEVKDGADVRPAILTESGEYVYTGDFSPGGEFTYRVRNTGDYRVIFDNSKQTSSTSHVYVKILLDFMDGPVTTATPTRQKAAIFGSLALFVLIAAWSAKKLLPAIAERRNPMPPSLFD